MASAPPSRLDPKTIATLLPRDQGFGTSLKVATAITVCALSYFLWVFVRPPLAWLLLGTFILMYMVHRLNLIKLSWLRSELFSVEPSFGQTPSRSRGRLIKARYIEAGEIICNRADYEGLSEIEATLQAQQTLYTSVVATLPKSNGRVELGLLGSPQTEKVDPDEEYYYLGRLSSFGHRKKALTEGNVDAFLALMDLLPWNQGGRREEAIVKELARSLPGISDFSARHAIRVAEAVGLVRRYRSHIYLGDFIRLLDRKSRMGGHKNCFIKLTELGHLWLRSVPSTPKESTAAQAAIGMINVNNYHEDTTVNYGPSVNIGRSSFVAGNQINQSDPQHTAQDIASLARELALLRSELKTQAFTPEQDSAVGEVANAQLAAEKGDGPAAMSHLAQLREVGKWVLGVAATIGAQVAASAISQAIGK